MACAMVLRRQSTLELNFEDASPLNRQRTTPADVLSALSVLTRSASRVNMEHRGQKRKRGLSIERDASIDRPIKRQRVFSTEDLTTLNNVGQAIFNSIEHIPVHFIATEQEPMPSGSEAMDTNGAQLTFGATLQQEAPQSLHQIVNSNAEAAMDTTEAGALPGNSTNPDETSMEGAVGGELLSKDSGAASPALAGKFEEDFQIICEIHPEVDTVHIREQLTLNVNDPNRVSTVTFEIYSKQEAGQEVPQRADREASEFAAAELERLSNMPFDLEQFLARYPDPMGTFNVVDTEVTELYYDHAEVFLKNEFRLVQVNFIKKLLQKCGFHLTPAYLALENELTGSKKRKNRKYPRSQAYDYPEEADEDFYWERLFLLNKAQILGHIEAGKEAKRLRFEQAQREGRLRECAICLATDVLLEDMAPCSEGHHLFCLDCIRQSTEEQLGQGKAAFPCLEAGCPATFSLWALEKALQSQTFSLVVRRIQIEELRQAQIQNIVTCPFCPYAVIIPDGDSSCVFHCENPDCMEDSCRNCRDIVHIPFTCAEFKKKKEEDMLHFVENRMAEAMIRQCPKCDLRFFKEEGCNTMTCSVCQTRTCYICREAITGYDHFRKSPGCNDANNMQQRHRNEVLKAFGESEIKFKEENPELNHARIKLLQNPLEVLDI